MLLLVALSLGYLCGSFPSAYLIARARGRDVFAVGSGSMGAMNTARNLGALPGVAVLLLDVGKGALATFIGTRLALLGGAASADTGNLLLPAVVAGIGAVAGHCYSVFVRFRGGKGLAVALGVALPLYWLPAAYGVIFIVAVVLITKSSDTASLATLFAYPVITLLTLDRLGWAREDTFLVTTGIVVMALIALPRQLQALRHRRRAT